MSSTLKTDIRNVNLVSLMLTQCNVIYSKHMNSSKANL